MRRFSTIVIAFIFGAMATQSIAQESTEEQAEAETTTQVDETAPSTENDAQTAVVENSEDQTPAEEVVAVHGDWQIRCRTDNNSCFMYQLAIDAREIPIAEMSIVPLDAQDDRVAGFTVVTPLRCTSDIRCFVKGIYGCI